MRRVVSTRKLEKDLQRLNKKLTERLLQQMKPQDNITKMLLGLLEKGGSTPITVKQAYGVR